MAAKDGGDRDTGNKIQSLPGSLPGTAQALGQAWGDAKAGLAWPLQERGYCKAVAPPGPQSEVQGQAAPCPPTAPYLSMSHLEKAPGFYPHTARSQPESHPQLQTPQCPQTGPPVLPPSGYNRRSASCWTKPSSSGPRPLPSSCSPPLLAGHALPGVQGAGRGPIRDRKAPLMGYQWWSDWRGGGLTPLPAGQGASCRGS